jgi:hypothetical protein
MLFFKKLVDLLKKLETQTYLINDLKRTNIGYDKDYSPIIIDYDANTISSTVEQVQSFRCDMQYPELYSGIKQSIEGFVAIIFELFFETEFKPWKKPRNEMNCHNHEEIATLMSEIKKKPEIPYGLFGFLIKLIYTDKDDGLFSNNPSTFVEVYEKINKSGLFA